MQRQRKGCILRAGPARPPLLRSDPPPPRVVALFPPAIPTLSPRPPGLPPSRPLPPEGNSRPLGLRTRLSPSGQVCTDHRVTGEELEEPAGYSLPLPLKALRTLPPQRGRWWGGAAIGSKALLWMYFIKRGHHEISLAYGGAFVYRH